MRCCRLLIVETERDRAQMLRSSFSKYDPSSSLEIVESAGMCAKALADDLYSALIVTCVLDDPTVQEFVRKLRADGLTIPILALAQHIYDKEIQPAAAILDGEIIQIENDEFNALPRLVHYAIEKHALKSQLATFEHRLIQSEKLAMIGLLAGGIAHDLRNPLNTIDAIRYYLAGLPSLREPALQERLDVIHKNVQRASGIITNLLEFSRPSKLRREAIEINSVLDSALALFGKELSAKKIEVVNRYEKVPLVFLNLDAVKQVFLNLLMNAVQAMPDGGTLTLSTKRGAQKDIEIAISDTGVGISKESMQRLFAPFFTTKAEKEGNGLGLYVSNLIIEREGGKITLESEQGKGTTSRVHLPVNSSPSV